MSYFLDILKRPPFHPQGCLIKQGSTLYIMRYKYVDVQLSSGQCPRMTLLRLIITINGFIAGNWPKKFEQATEKESVAYPN